MKRTTGVGLLQALAISCLFAAALTSSGWAQGDVTRPAGRKETPARPENKSALDDELLKDLGPDPLADEKDAMPAASSPDQRRAAGATENEGDSLDRELLKGLGEGEDVGEPGEGNPLARLSRAMREVEALVAERRTDSETQRRQAQLVRDIDELIRRAKQPKQGGGSSSSSSKGGQQGTGDRQVSQPGRQPSQGPQFSEAPARDSTKEARQDRTRKPDMADMREILKGVWGQLPQRQREQMLQSYEEKFLPKYEEMISDYFRSLAEEPARKP